MTYRAYCDECNWQAEDAWTYEENAYVDLTRHNEDYHTEGGVRQE
jgi:hypothetical protein